MADRVFETHRLESVNGYIELFLSTMLVRENGS
jgi:hypothetical protein